MGNVLLIEETNVLKWRLEKALKAMGFSQVHIYDNRNISFRRYLKGIENLTTVIIDYDQFSEEFDDILNSVNTQFKDSKVNTVVLSSKMEVSEMMKFFVKGVDDILLKPFKNQLLYKKLGIENKNRHIEHVSYVKNTIKGSNVKLKWSKEFEIGVEEIDKEHKEIIDSFEKLYKMMKIGKGHDEYEEIMKFLDHYVNTHLDHEEELQKRIEFEELDYHISLHEEFKSHIKEMLSRYNGDVSNSELLKLNLFVKEWLLKHILSEDRKIAEAIKNRK